MEDGLKKTQWLRWGESTAKEQGMIAFFLFGILGLFLSFSLFAANSQADSKEEKAPVCLSREEWLRTIKQLRELKDEIAKQKASIDAQGRIMQSREQTHQAILQSERLKCDLQIKALTQSKPCPPPTACYVALGITGAVCVGLGVGGYALGRSSKP